MVPSNTKTLKEILNVLVLKVSAKSKLKSLLDYQEKTLIYFIHAQEESDTILFGS